MRSHVCPSASSANLAPHCAYVPQSTIYSACTRVHVTQLIRVTTVAAWMSGEYSDETIAFVQTRR